MTLAVPFAVARRHSAGDFPARAPSCGRAAASTRLWSRFASV